MIWSEFKDLVRVHLHAFNKTHGVQTLIETLLRGGVEDLQSAVVQLRVRTNKVPVTSVTVEGEAAKVAIPVGSRLTDLYARSTTDSSESRQYFRVQSGMTRELIAGTIPFDSRMFTYDSATGVVYVSPIPANEESEICLSYSTISADYSDSAETPLGASEAEAVANYMLSRLVLTVDSDISKAGVHSNLYRSLKRQIMSDRNEAHVSSP